MEKLSQQYAVHKQSKNEDGCDSRGCAYDAWFSDPIGQRDSKKRRFRHLWNDYPSNNIHEHNFRVYGFPYH